MTQQTTGSPVRFRAEIHLEGKTATGIQVPDEVVAGLGAGKRPPVRVTINGYTYRTTVAPMGGAYWIPLSAENRAGASAGAGDIVEVEITLDTQPRVVEVPADFAASLAQEDQAKRFFDSLSYSNRLRLVLGIEGAKTPETRQRRIEKTLNNLREGKI